MADSLGSFEVRSPARPLARDAALDRFGDSSLAGHDDAGPGGTELARHERPRPAPICTRKRILSAGTGPVAAAALRGELPVPSEHGGREVVALDLAAARARSELLDVLCLMGCNRDERLAPVSERLDRPAATAPFHDFPVSPRV